MKQFVIDYFGISDIIRGQEQLLYYVKRFHCFATSCWNWDIDYRYAATRPIFGGLHRSNASVNWGVSIYSTREPGKRALTGSGLCYQVRECITCKYCICIQNSTVIITPQGHQSTTPKQRTLQSYLEGLEFKPQPGDRIYWDSTLFHSTFMQMQDLRDIGTVS